MATLLAVDGFQMRMFSAPREHPPAHVHVVKADGEVIIILPPLAVRRINGMRTVDVLAAVRLVEAHLDLLLTAWSVRHG